ncbi:MAG: L-aspartate oxidase [Rikenellaceae bacterium]
MNTDTDFLVIGSGVAALSYALQVADYGKVVIITKDTLGNTNTSKAQGGIAAVVGGGEEKILSHIEDTMVCGSQRSDREVVEMVIRGAESAIERLVDWGVGFNKGEKGDYTLAREGGHSEHRILHNEDLTGLEIQNRLIERVLSHKNIEVREHHFAVDLLTQHHLGKLVKRSLPGTECYGAYVLDKNTEEVYTLRAKRTVVATGGIGNIYHTSTNPMVATGDGVAMVHRAKGRITDMEFVQFHPTALYEPGVRPSFLISEAVRGFGAVLRDKRGVEFMAKYHPMGALAPRDVVARSIDNELKISGDEYVYLDITHKPAKEIIAHFPNIYKKCMSIGLDITKEMIPVRPAAHYLCGGVDVDKNSQSSIKRLYAIGEVARTGLHGANRLASNSLLEAVVFARMAAEHSVCDLAGAKMPEIPDWDFRGTTHTEEMVLITQSIKEMQQIMSYYVGIVRSNIRLERAMHRLQTIYEETEHLYRSSVVSVPLCELRNMVEVSYLVIKQATERRESVGLHYSLDLL